MTDQAQDVNANPVPPTAPAPPLTPEQFEAVKRSLVERLHKQYGDFINSIAHFPASPAPMGEAFRFFDTGFIWFEKAIANMPMPNVQVIEAPVAPPQPANDVTPPDAA